MAIPDRNAEDPLNGATMDETVVHAPPAPATPWGDTCPILKIANHYAVDYGVLLHAADFFIHGRKMPDDVPWDYEEPDVLEDATAQVRQYAERFKALQAGFAR